LRDTTWVTAFLLCKLMRRLSVAEAGDDLFGDVAHGAVSAAGGEVDALEGFRLRKSLVLDEQSCWHLLAC
jgi:hypothetical protein